ncbi:UPF0575 protein C19orf67 homolog [Symphorus nematophorus]
MTDLEVQREVQIATNPPSGQHACAGLQEDMSGQQESDHSEGLQNTAQGEVEQSLSLLADVALALPCGDLAACSCVEGSLQFMQLPLQFLMSKADDLQDCPVNGQGDLDREALAAAVLSFLYTCQPYFNHLESTARSPVAQLAPLPFDNYTRLLDFSQQLCDRLEQLVLTYASYNLLCLDETEPNGLSNFGIGQIQVGRLRLSMFRYCRPTPYLSRVDTGLYKRMRWNVDRLRDEQQQTEEEQGGESEDREAETVGDTEYYFLCCEDISSAEADGNSQGVSHGNVVRMWSIGQWEQVNPETEDIYDWILCEVPQGSYHRLLLLGSDEPSSCRATDLLQQLLLSRQTTE